MLLFIDTDTTELEFDQITVIDGQEYILEFIWSERENVWILNLLTSDGVPLAMGIYLNVGVDLLARWRTDTRVPQGLLTVIDMSNTGAVINSPEDLNGNFPLGYLTSDDPMTPFFLNV